MLRVNCVTAYERSKNIIWFSSSSADPLAAWRISGMIFARDSSYALLGQGHLRMEFQFVFEDGTHYAFADWMGEAVITDTGGEEDGKGGEIKGWFSSVRSWGVLRAVAGPYCLTFREFTSLVDGKTYISGFLTRDGIKVFGALVSRPGIGSNVDWEREYGLVLR